MTPKTTTVGPRIEFNTHGYISLRCYSEGTEYRLYLHRLTAYAHGEIDSLDSPMHIHHLDADPWNNHPENLEALTPEQHEQIDPHVANLRL